MWRAEAAVFLERERERERERKRETEQERGRGGRGGRECVYIYVNRYCSSLSCA